MLAIFHKRNTIVACLASLLMANGPVSAQQGNWTLESAMQRVLEVAPERRAAEAEVVSRQGNLRQASRWRNPSIEVGATDAIGKNDGKGGISLNEITIKQSLPLSGRLDLQRQQANSSLKQAEAAVGEQNLELEYETAHSFHTLQLNQARMTMAEQRLQSADEFQRIGRRREQAGDLSKLERLRLDLIRENASQQIATAEGELSESVSNFRTLLNLGDAGIGLATLDEPPQRPELAALEAGLEHHPALVAAKQRIEAARHGVELAQVNRFSDPEIWLARGRDYLGNERQSTTSFGVAVSVPLWDDNSGHIDSARAARDRSQFELEALQRQLRKRLHLSHMHLGHLIEQTQDYRDNVLEPATQVFELSRRGFAAGEVEILALVDAVNSYFEARSRYLELMEQAWLEAAELRRAAGTSLLNGRPNLSEGTAQ